MKQYRIMCIKVLILQYEIKYRRKEQQDQGCHFYGRLELSWVWKDMYIEKECGKKDEGRKWLSLQVSAVKCRVEGREEAGSCSFQLLRLLLL